MKKWRIEKLGEIALQELKSLVGWETARVRPFSGRPLARVHTVSSDVEGDYLVEILDQEGIPALFQSNRDTAYDGLFVGQWGHGTIITREEDAHRALTVIESVLTQIERESQSEGKTESKPEEG